MVNKALFSSARGAQLPAAMALNHEGAPAYALARNDGKSLSQSLNLVD